ncbi:hypothetical protein [Burkholderia ubonensis]|uniref:hypothetical protein n=1 Tax=Burkholderia ubonensis TaxID=101571 RepID=UPI0012FBD5CA|nr:hypothetical protein [Burkholderia ubonensis]
MKLKKSISSLISLLIFAGCAAQITPQMREQADKRKDESIKVSTSLEGSDDFSRRCGYAKPDETVGCSQKILRWKLEDKAKNYCVFYRMGTIRYNGTSGALYNRATFAEADVTCLGSQQG